jgi:hypothetical protein
VPWRTSLGILYEHGLSSLECQPDRQTPEHLLETLRIPCFWRPCHFDGVLQFVRKQRDDSISRPLKVHGDSEVAPRTMPGNIMGEVAPEHVSRHLRLQIHDYSRTRRALSPGAEMSPIAPCRRQ